MFPRFRLTAALIIAALPLAACATPAERQLKKVSLASEQLWAQYDACMTRVEGTAAYQRLNRAYILKRDDPRSIEKMAIGRLAGDQEKADLLVNKKNTDRCNQELFRGFAEINPGFNVLLARFMSEDDELDLRTVQDEVTVGARNLIVHQRFAKRLRDWNFAGERIVRLYTWRLRRTCSIYCSSFSAASLLPPSTGGMSNVAAATPPPPADGQEAGLQQFVTTPEPLTQEAETAAAPAAPAVQAVEITALPASQEAEIAAAPAVPAVRQAETTGVPASQEAEIATAPTAPAVQGAQIIAAPPTQEPATAAAPAAPAVQEAEISAVPASQEAEIATAPTAPKAAEEPPAQVAETPATPAVQKTEPAAESPAQKSAVVAAPAAQEAATTAEPAPQTTGSALKPPTHDVDTGLRPAAGPADEPAKPQEQRVEVASTPKTAQPRYTVHLASMRSEVEARAQWGQLQARYPAILGDRVLFTREVKIGGRGTFVRVLTGLFNDRGQARDFCGQLGGGKQYCMVLRL